jgi:hypothetical protein
MNHSKVIFRFTELQSHCSHRGKFCFVVYGLVAQSCSAILDQILDVITSLVQISSVITCWSIVNTFSRVFSLPS